MSDQPVCTCRSFTVNRRRCLDAERCLLHGLSAAVPPEAAPADPEVAGRDFGGRLVVLMNEQQWREATLLCISKIDQLHTVTSPDPARAAFVAQVRVYFNNWGNREPITRLMGLIVQSFSVAYMQQHGQPETLRAIAEALEKATDDPL